jgi:hypothetical protein
MPQGIYKRTEKNNNAKGKHWKLSDETRQKMSASKKGIIPKNNNVLKYSMLGKKFTNEHKEKLRLAKLGKPRAGNPEKWKHTEETKRKNSEAHKGKPAWNKGKSGYKSKPCSEETKRKISESNFGIPRPQTRGANNHLWKGGLTPINFKIRASCEYKIWRKSVFERDNYTCVFCGIHGVAFHADHIKPFSLFPELRFAIDNGRTLCIPCHKKTDSYLGNFNKNYKNKCQPQ